MKPVRLTLEQAVKAVIEASEGSVPLNNDWVYSILSKALEEDSMAVLVQLTAKEVKL